MGRHAGFRRPSRRGSWSVRIRALLCLGILAAPAAVGTMAYWTDEATITSGTFTSGTLDLTVGASAGDSAHLQGQGGSFEYSQLTIANLVPGESIARPFVVRNFGNVPLAYNASITTENDELVASGSGLRVQVFTGGAPTNTGSESSGNRTGTCPGGTSVSNQAVSTTSTGDIHGTDQTLQPGTVREYCALITLHSSSPNALQGRITSLTIHLDAQQLGAP